MGTHRPASPCQPGAQYAIPPHDCASHEHQGGSHSEYCPNRLGSLIAEPGAAARNSDAINAAEMQEGKPVNDAVDDAEPGVHGRGRLKPVGQLLNLLGESEIETANPKDDREREAPETDHTM